ncbi:MAG TPA: hypothetical protein VMU26_27290 [Candidatus Polarisedimenticolia bacterium]|nr:hypothetical protein [Candidatus Polarisedimenticolia bacterium]
MMSGSAQNEEEPVVANVQSKFFSSLEGFDVAWPDSAKRCNTERTYGGGLGQATDIGLCGIGSIRSASLRFQKVFDLFLGDSEFSQDLLVWNGLVMLQPFARFRECLFFVRSDRFVVERGVSNGAGHRIEHGFEQADDGGSRSISL